jgi:hypothetical protein
VELQGDPVFGLAFSLREVEVDDFNHEESVCVGLLGNLGSLGVGGWGLGVGGWLGLVSDSERYIDNKPGNPPSHIPFTQKLPPAP